MDKKVLEAYRDLCLGIAEIINDNPDGVPAGPMYMAFAEKGLSLHQFEAMMNALVMTGQIRKSGHQYFPVKK